MPVTFNGQNLTPAPLVNISRDFNRIEGFITSSVYTITLNGTIVNVGTSLDSPGAQSGFETVDVLGGQQVVRQLFREGSDGNLLSITSPEGSSNGINAYCNVESVNFNAGVWVNRCDYSVVLTADRLEGDPDGGAAASGLESVSENWSVNENPDTSWVLTHNVEAKGRLVYGSGGRNNPLQNARNYVGARKYSIGTTGTLSHPSAETYAPSGFISNFNNNSLYWNYSIVENVDPVNFNYGITENFLYYPSGNAIETWSASFTVNPDNAQKAEMTVDGSINGLANNNSNFLTKSANASGYFKVSVEPNLYTRLLNYVPAGYSLGTDVLTKNVIYDYSNGLLRYTYGFNAWKGNLIPGSIEEEIQVNDNGPIDIFAEIPIPFRSNGPIIQSMYTRTVPERSVSINVRMSPSGTLSSGSLLAAYLAKPNTDSLVQILQPSAGYFYLVNNSEEWSPTRRQYSRQVTWHIDNQGSGVNGIPSMIHSVPN